MKHVLDWSLIVGVFALIVIVACLLDSLVDRFWRRRPS